MEFSKISFATVVAFTCSMVLAQEIATWSGDRQGAASFTFDDGAPSHVNDAGPMFDKYGYRGTFNLVVNWSPDWNGFQNMANNGHEIASHSNSHGQNMSGEEASSKQSIQQKINQKYGCITVAYPNCNVPNASAVLQNYIAGRVCNASWASIPSDIIGKDGPSDWAKVPAIMTGSENGLQGTNSFTGKMNEAATQNGWVMFLTHGFSGKSNGSANYSPTNINDIDGALSWAKQNDDKIWVAPFRNVAMYIKERKASKVNKKSGDANKIVFDVTHDIKDNISDYDYPLTIKINNENNWSKVKATQGGADIEAIIKNGNILVDVVPNAGDVEVSNGDASSTPTTPTTPESSSSVNPTTPESSSSINPTTPASSSSRGFNPWGNFGRSSSSIGDADKTSSSSITPAAISTKAIDEFPIFAFVDNNGYIVVGNAKGMNITVVNSLGHVVRTTKGLGFEQKVYSGAKGMYIVRVGNKAITLNIR